MGARMRIPAGARVEYDDTPGVRQPLHADANVQYDDAAPPVDPAALDAKIRRGLFPVQGMTPDETFANALNSRVTPTLTPAVSAAASFTNSLVGKFGDEIGAAADAATNGKPWSQFVSDYRASRDDIRRSLKYSQEANPKASLAGDVAGSLASAVVPGMGLAKGAKLGKVVLQAAKQGAVMGLGDSEADLTRGEFAQAAKDAALSGALAAAGGTLVHGALRGIPALAKGISSLGFHGIAEGFAGSEGRVAGRLVRDIAGGEGAETIARASTMRTLEARAGHEAKALEQVAEETGLKRALATQAMSSPEKAAKKVAAVIGKIGDGLDATYEKIGEVPLSKVTGELDTLSKSLLKQGYEKAAGVVAAKRNSYVAAFGSEADATIHASALRNLRREIGEEAFAAAPGARVTVPTAAKREVYGALSRVIEDSAKGNPEVDLAALKTLNRQMSILIPARDALVERAAKEKAGRTALHHLIDHAKTMAVGGALGFAEGGHAALGAVALPVAKKLAAVGVRNVDYAMAKLVRAAQNGSTTAHMTQMAIQLGIPATTARDIAKRMRSAGAGGGVESPIVPSADAETPAERVAPGEESEP